MCTSPVLSIDTNNKASFYCASKNMFSQRGLWFHSYTQSKEAVCDCQNTREVTEYKQN